MAAQKTQVLDEFNRDNYRIAEDFNEVLEALNACLDVRDSDGDPVVHAHTPTGTMCTVRYARRYQPIILNKDGTRNRRQGNEYQIDVNRVLVPRDFTSGPTLKEEEKALASIMKTIRAAALPVRGVVVKQVNLESVEKQLREERTKQLSNGHDWDVADVMDVLRRH